MLKNKAAPAGVDEYIAGFPPGTKKLLEQLRSVIKKAAPWAEEVISYKMPAYKYYGLLVYFAGYEKHIGFYPMPVAIRAFKKELAVYKSSKGAVQFPLDKKIPVTLISKIVKFRMKENKDKLGIKKSLNSRRDKSN